MSRPFFIRARERGEGDLLQFRDAAITCAAARRLSAPLLVDADAATWELLQWLGIQGLKGASESSLCYVDPTRMDGLPAGVEGRPLALFPPDLRSLRDYRERGYVAEALFSALIRSSYGPDHPDFFPTLSELGFYFDDALLLRGQARWDEEYLEACQAFFMEELMPAELLQKSLDCLPEGERGRLRDTCGRFAQELHGVTFLLAAQLQTLVPLAELLRALLGRSPVSRDLSQLLKQAPTWTPAEFQQAWDGLSSEGRARLTQELCAGFSEHAAEILFAAGPEMLGWRNQLSSVGEPAL